MLPLILVTTLLLARFAIRYTTQSTISQTKASTIATEAIGAVRTVHSLGAEEYFAERQAEAVNKAHQSLILRARAEAYCMAGIQFTIYSGYALAFFYGSQLIRTEGLEPGIVISVILALVIGSFALSQIPSNIQSQSISLVIDYSFADYYDASSRLCLCVFIMEDDKSHHRKKA